ncbi:MAG: ABC transporter permease [Dehalococcoidales bacterium]|nr:ABC transporter permease [Dehalococcoidales bacterium]
MKFIEFFSIAIRSLFANKLRSSLTMLGVIIGVGAVITLMSVGRGAQAVITSMFEQLGTNVLYVMSRSPEAPGSVGLSPMIAMPTLTLDDAEALKRVRSVLAIAPVNENFAEVTAGGKSKTAIIHGATPDYQQVMNYSVALGEFISDRNVASRDMVVVLGDKVAEDLFGSDNPLRQRVKIKGQRFTVIGVLEAKGGAMLGFSPDDVVVTPITTYQARLFTQRTARGEDAVQSISVQVASAELMDEVSEEIKAILRKRHRLAEGDKDDFAIISQEQMLGMVEQVIGVFTIFLGAIASISLLVGGIGIMNIMLVSVTERTREIGIRKAVGAKRRDILLQFLIEAATLSFTGGGIGILGGWLLSTLISRIDIGGGQTIPAVVSPDIVILAISVSIIIGLVSGIYPAMRAARLNPIDALRYG